MMCYHQPSDLACAWLGKARAWTTLCRAGGVRQCLLNNLVRSGGLVQKEVDPPRLCCCTGGCGDGSVTPPGWLRDGRAGAEVSQL